MQVDPAHAELVGRVVREARRLVGEHASAAYAAIRLAELSWHDIDAVWDAHTLVLEELDTAPTAVASDMLPLLEAAADYYDEAQNGSRCHDAGPLEVQIVELHWPAGDEP